MRHIFPVGMQGVVGHDADGFDIVKLFPLFQFIHHLRGENVRAEDHVGRVARDHPGELGRPEGVDDVDDAGAGGEITARQSGNG